MGCTTSTPTDEIATERSAATTAAARRSRGVARAAAMALGTPAARPPSVLGSVHSSLREAAVSSRAHGPAAGVTGPCYGDEVLCFNGATASQVSAKRNSLPSIPPSPAAKLSKRDSGSVLLLTASIDSGAADTRRDLSLSSIPPSPAAKLSKRDSGSVLLLTASIDSGAADTRRDLSVRELSIQERLARRPAKPAPRHVDANDTPQSPSVYFEAAHSTSLHPPGPEGGQAN
jgi:hypothetical protein